jgi:hypothetical protein
VKQYFAHIERAQHHACSKTCQAHAQRRGGQLDLKKRQVMLDHYGVENPQQVTAIKEKTRVTNLERYGHEVSSQADVVKERARQTNRERFGVDWHTQSQNFADKAHETWQKRYGVDHPMQADEVKAKYDFADIWQKAHKTKKLNGTYASSKAEDRFYKQLIGIFGKVKRQAPIQHEEGTWFIDFRVGDVYVQFDGEYWHGLDRSIEVIRESTKKRDCFIAKRYDEDRSQDAWFMSRGLKLIRITDRRAKTLSDDELHLLLTGTGVGN